jgi:hypothetical protein
MRARDESGEREAAYAERDVAAGAAWPGVGRPLAVLPDEPPPAPRRPWGLRAALLAAAIAAWTLAGDGGEATGTPLSGAAPWQIELATAGTRPTPVLVFGRAAGIHLVRVRPAGSARRTALPAPVADGAVWMISLGRAPLDVRGRGGPDSPLRGFTARGRVIKAFESPSGSGVRTW